MNKWKDFEDFVNVMGDDITRIKREYLKEIVSKLKKEIVYHEEMISLLEPIVQRDKDALKKARKELSIWDVEQID